MRLEFTIPGDPVGKGRPRFTRTGFAYTDKRTASFENLVRLAFTEKYPDAVPSELPVSLSIIARHTVPKSWPKKRRIAALCEQLFKTSKPDLDNIIKSVSDGLNGVAFKDDSQIYELHARKSYAETPSTTVRIILQEGEHNEQTE